MSRIRTLKPEFFRSRSLARCSIAARLTFEGLWCEADDHGRGVADARLLKGALWALDDDITPPVVEEHLAELAREHITLYEIDGERYFEIRSWGEHQAASHRRGSPQHPAPPVVQTTSYPEPPKQEPHDEACKKVQDARPIVLEQGTGNGEGNRETALVPAAPGPVEVVFEAWKEAAGKNGRTMLDRKRRGRITEALKAYPVDDLVDAVRGWRHSPHHRGENERATVYNDLELLLRDAKHIEHFRDLERAHPSVRAAPRLPRGADAIGRALADREAAS